MPDLTTLAALKQWDSTLATTNADALLSSLITATSADFLREIERPDLLAATYTEQRIGDGSCRLILRHWPVTAVAGVVLSGTSLDPSEFYFDSSLDPERTYVLYLTPGNVFPDAQLVAVTYTAGYTEVPADIGQAVMEWAVLRYKKKSAAGQTQMRNLEGERSDVDPSAIPSNTQRVIELYKRKWPAYGRIPAQENGGGSPSMQIMAMPARKTGGR